MKHVWVIEIKEGEKWLPCAAAYLSRIDARRYGLPDWRDRNPNDAFRIARYDKATGK